MLSVENSRQNSYNTSFGCKKIKTNFASKKIQHNSAVQVPLSPEEKYYLAHSMPSSILKVLKIIDNYLKINKILKNPDKYI